MRDDFIISKTREMGSEDGIFGGGAATYTTLTSRIESKNTSDTDFFSP